MAEHVEHWVAEVSDEVLAGVWPRITQDDLDYYIGQIVVKRGLTWVYGEAAGAGGYGGLDEAVTEIIGDSNEFSCGSLCGLQVEFVAGSSITNSAFSLRCERSLHNTEEEAVAKELKCRAVQRRVTEDLPVKVRSYATMVRELREDEVAINTNAARELKKINDRLGELL